jgi:hypothetical protein
MILKLILVKSDGTEELLASGPPQIPLQWKSPPSQPIIYERGGDNGSYIITAFTVQPTAILSLQYGKQINPNQVKVF